MNSSRCAGCKHLRRRCPSDCILAPYFPANNRKRFEDVHKIYGASNVSKMLEDLPVHLREDAANSLCHEANCRIQNPVHGIVGEITVIQQQIYDLQSQLAQVQAQIVVANASAQTDQNINPNVVHNQQPNLDNGFGVEQNDDDSGWFF